jgi:hypothetical protein
MPASSAPTPVLRLDWQRASSIPTRRSVVSVAGIPLSRQDGTDEVADGEGHQGCRAAEQELTQS